MIQLCLNSVENIVRKGKNMLVTSILFLFQKCFQMPFVSVIKSRDCSKGLTLYQTSPVFTCLQDKSFENTVGKGEITHKELFLLFPQCILLVWRISAIFI